ncbi:hypothetical protein LPJ78_005255 [Coemansia sp. RSA 989]|nr:hypothetical protein LPJ78_005255 [Coemansia sp. RSA 989]KAJ1870382.1 hypothetical protein LPJ55_004700 [Coemansia sp. RSA 990]KAJ2668233.1 hypothetical protein IWW42_005354 [Coemansia sp. RSA 1085]
MAPMKGLTVFVADLRKCRSHEEEERRVNKELANIRVKFKEHSLNSYNRKKYVCKLMYMSLLGYDVNFGHKEAVELANSAKYSEKQIGYLAVSLLINEDSGFMRSVLVSLRRDIHDTNEFNVCLALCAITNVPTREIAEALTEDILMQLLSPASSIFVKKKASLCLLRLFRRFPEQTRARTWAARVIPYMGHRDIGVTLSVTSLATALAQQFPEEMRKAASFAIRRLKSLVIDREFSVDYVYYKVPAPWLQIKLLRLLQYFAAPSSPELRSQLLSILRHIIDVSQDVPRELQQMNAQYSILFEAINLGIHLDIDQGLMHESAMLLGRFITSRETNVRYLGLETMSHLAAYIDSLAPLKRYQGVIIQSLRDRDVSVRRRALDLLYSMCDVDSAKPIVSELLRHMATADLALREEMALKVAILTEKYATEYSWYVDVMMRLVSLAGDHMGDEVWHRIVQVILGNEELQLYACKISLQTLKAPVCHESAFKVSAYVLGEFGHLIANASDSAPIDQLKALQSKMSATSLPARAVALTTIAKFINLFPEIKNLCLRVLDRYRNALDAELQQRACEYYALATVESQDLLATVFEEMPPFPERQSALMSRLLKQEGNTEDQRTWIPGGRDINRKHRAQNSSQQDLQEDAPESSFSGAPKESEQAATDPAAALTPEEQERIAKSRKHYARLLWENDGILYDGDEIQVGLMAQYKPPAGRVGVFLGNKSAAAIYEISVHAFVKQSETKSADCSALEVQLSSNQSPLPESLMPMAQTRIYFDVKCKHMSSTPPTLRISYTLAGAPSVLELQLPVTAAHFMDPVTITVNDFFARWKQLGEAAVGGESQAVLKTPFLSSGTEAIQWLRSVVGGMGFALIQGADPVPDNLVAVGIATTEDGRFGCLLRVEPKVSHRMTRVTIRATNETLAKVVATNIGMVFASR